MVLSSSSPGIGGVEVFDEEICDFMISVPEQPKGVAGRLVRLWMCKNVFESRGILGWLRRTLRHEQSAWVVGSVEEGVGYDHRKSSSRNERGTRTISQKNGTLENWDFTTPTPPPGPEVMILKLGGRYRPPEVQGLKKIARPR